LDSGRSTNFGVSTAFGVPATGGASEDCGASAIAGALAAGFAGAVVAEVSLDSVRFRGSSAWAAADAKTKPMIRRSLRMILSGLADGRLA
jgi:hypothetical protein